MSDVYGIEFMSHALNKIIMCAQELDTESGYGVGHEKVIEVESTSESEESQCYVPLSKASFSYSVKVVNPQRMKDFCTVDLGRGKAFETLKLLRESISKNLPSSPNFDKPDVLSVEVGYVEPGHGKKVWLMTDEDVQKMYEKHEGKPSIRLWCYSCMTKNV